MLQRLLSKRPEQEKHLLELIVDKLGDLDSSVAAKTLHLLNQLCKENESSIAVKNYSIYVFHSGTTSSHENCRCQ